MYIYNSVVKQIRVYTILITNHPFSKTMGLCKCPKRRVTNQFCYEHRVNVCEYCIVTNHPNCVVQSYLHWLQDSDYSPLCILCSKNLMTEDCVRLTCYHVFHWACLDLYARKMPSTTAPAGFTCPQCKLCIFPQPNLVSQVADVLREKLAGVNWARVGLGLPLLSEELNTSNVVHTDSRAQSDFVTQNNSVVFEEKISNHCDAVVHLEGPVMTYSRAELTGQIPRRLNKAAELVSSTECDHDENKYKRRSFFDWLKRWLNNNRIYSRRCTSIPLRYCKLAAILLMAMSILVLFINLGRSTAADDPALDPKSNAHIRISNE